MEETHILEINLISAQGLVGPSSRRRRFKTYAVAWVDPSCKLRSRLDLDGSHNPTWNDKFLFRVTADFLSSDVSAASVQIFAVGFFRPRLLGSARFLISNFLPGGLATSISAASAALKNPSFTALQIRRPSGCFQGILNVGVMLVNESDFPGFGGIWAMGHRDLMRRRNLHHRTTSCEVSVDNRNKFKSATAWISGNFLCGLLPENTILLPPDREIETNSAPPSVASDTAAVASRKEIQNLEGKERLIAGRFATLLCRLFAHMAMTPPPSDQKMVEK